MDSMMTQKHLHALLAFALLFAGCTMTQQGIPADQLKTNLFKIKFGDTTQQVAALIGPPIRINAGSTATGGSTVEWVYTESQFRTAGQSFAVGLATGSGTPIHEVTLYLTFTNNRLTAKRSQS